MAYFILNGTFNHQTIQTFLSYLAVIGKLTGHVVAQVDVVKILKELFQKKCDVGEPMTWK